MIYTPAIHVTCDAQWCESRLTFPVDLDREMIVQRLLVESHWLTRDGQYFCSDVCAGVDHWEDRCQQPHRWPLTACTPLLLEPAPAPAVSLVVTSGGIRVAPEPPVATTPRSVRGESGCRETGCRSHVPDGRWTHPRGTGSKWHP
jgi:hypothetical protein